MGEIICRAIDEYVSEPTGEEIVRCRDCACLVENDTFYDCKHFNCHLYWNEGQEPDGFCFWGERREK